MMTNKNHRKVLKNRQICPHLGNPFVDCYCIKQSSQYIERIIYFCGNNYESCGIYTQANNNKSSNKLSQSKIHP
jgi:hypothetical protein